MFGELASKLLLNPHRHASGFVSNQITGVSSCQKFVLLCLRPQSRSRFQARRLRVVLRMAGGGARVAVQAIITIQAAAMVVARHRPAARPVAERPVVAQLAAARPAVVQPAAGQPMFPNLPILHYLWRALPD
jgi:hypothetical protein